MESINLTENPSDFVESYFTKKNPELLVIVSYSVNFVRKTLDFVKIDSEVHQFYEKALELFSK